MRDKEELLLLLPPKVKEKVSKMFSRAQSIQHNNQHPAGKDFQQTPLLDW